MSVKDRKKSGVGDRSIMSVVILFRTDEVNIVYNSRRILITKFEMMSNQIAVVNVYVPAGSQGKNSFFDKLACAIKDINVDIF